MGTRTHSVGRYSPTLPCWPRRTLPPSARKSVSPPSTSRYALRPAIFLVPSDLFDLTAPSYRRYPNQAARSRSSVRSPRSCPIRSPNRPNRRCHPHSFRLDPTKGWSTRSTIVESAFWHSTSDVFPSTVAYRHFSAV